jgi:hypothetical protein
VDGRHLPGAPGRLASQVFFVANGAPPPSSPDHEGIVSLKNCIRVLDGFAGRWKWCCPSCDGYITADASIARNWRWKTPTLISSPLRRVLSQRDVTGGKQRKEGPLSQARA